MDKTKETELLKNIIELIEEQHPDAHDIVIAFDTKAENFLYGNTPCILCALEDMYSLAFKNGARHQGMQHIKDLAQAFVDALLPDDDKSQGEKELLEYLRNYKSEVKN